MNEVAARHRGLDDALDLKALREAGLIEAEPCGRFTCYRLRPEALKQLADALQALASAAEPAVKRPC